MNLFITVILFCHQSFFAGKFVAQLEAAKLAVDIKAILFGFLVVIQNEFFPDEFARKFIPPTPLWHRVYPPACAGCT